MFFARRKKSVERQSIFADMRVNQKRDFSVKLAERGESGERHGDQISYAADIHHHLVGAFVGKPAAELSNHRPPVLPLSLHPSTRGGLSYRAGKSDTPAREPFARSKLSLKCEQRRL